jgi:hypothetical protein
MDVFDFDPVVLETTASIVDGYCKKQCEIMDDYMSYMSSLSSEWDDDVTMGKLLEEIRQLQNSVEGVMDEIRSTYPAFFREKAEQIRNRPKFQ